MRRAGVAVTLSVLATVGCGGNDAAPPDAPTVPASPVPSSIEVSTTDFPVNGPIPARYTCTGANTSPELAWSNVPQNAAALALVVDDPDAPSGTFYHWLVVDIPTSTQSIAPGQPPVGGTQLPNSEQHAGYDGPCPPSGTHHYRFTVYALSKALGLAADVTPVQALEAIAPATIARGQLVGTFSK